MDRWEMLQDTQLRVNGWNSASAQWGSHLSLRDEKILSYSLSMYISRKCFIQKGRSSFTIYHTPTNCAVTGHFRRSLPGSLSWKACLRIVKRWKALWQCSTAGPRELFQNSPIPQIDRTWTSSSRYCPVIRNHVHWGQRVWDVVFGAQGVAWCLAYF